MSIKPLPEDVVAQIKSSININNLNSVILGLVRNSLDANATKINISLDYSRGNCSVEDDGLGILPSEFAEDGSLGQLHSTSKFPPRIESYGRYGVFLASLAALSLLSITSHHHGHHSHNCLSFHNSRVYARHTPALPEQRILTFPHGTRVTVRDLFGSMPVRVKHRALQATKGISVREWDQLILDVLALLFVWPGTVIISIREMSSRQSLSLKARTGESATASHQAGFPSRVPSLLQQASFCDVTEKELWVSLGASGPGISITGCVCLVPVATKRIQFISIGIEPLSNDSQNNVLYEEINRTFANSAFGCIEEESDRKGDLPIRMEDYTTRELKPRKGVDRWPIFCLTINLDKFAEKGETGIGEIADGRDTALSDVLTLLKAMFYEFLKRHLFRPKAASLMNDRSDKPRGSSSRSNTPVIQAKSSGRQKSRTSDNELVQLSHPPLATSVSVRQEQLPERPVSGLSSSFDSWSRVKAGRILPTFKAGSGDSTTPMSTLSTGSIDHSSREIDSRASAAKCRRPEKPCLFDSAGRLTRKPFDDVDLAGCTNESNADTVPRTSLEDQETVTWFNPLTTKTAIVNSRTGFVIQPQRIASGLSLQGGRPFLNNPTKPVETNNDASWIDDILRSWNNPVFELTEAPIPRLHNALDPLGNELEGSTHQCRGHNHLSLTKSHETSVMDSPGRLHRDDLRHAQLLAQVDKKFILAKIQSHAVAKEKFATRGDIGFHEMRPLLVLIDQHAADERCRVEKLMVEYFELDFSETGVAAWRSRTESLEKPLCFELSSRERDLLERYRPHFSHWGIIYNLHINTLQSKSKHRGGTELSVTRLPPGILERCRSEPRLLIELLRKEVWKLDDEPLSSRTGPVTEEASYGTSKPKTQYEARSWVSRFHGCPQGILDLINSRACRSAIMFNDPLSVEECASLLKSLADTAFPFQCAHGRPSMIPLLDLGNDLAATSPAVDEPPVGDFFASKFKEWKRTLYS